jgi:nucleoredoxin
MLGDTLLKGDAKIPSGEALGSKKHYGLYFSAHWCPPCKMFTPMLVDWYKKLHDKLDMDIVFVSSDQTKDQFEGYYGEMPWLALPYEARAEKAALSSKFGVEGIPTFVIVDSDGKLVADNGREMVMTDKEGAAFPWKPPAWEDLLASDAAFPTSDGGSVTGAELRAKKYIIAYFSAHWCGPCRAFTPQLVKATQELKARGEDLEVLFVSADRDEGAMKDYHASMKHFAAVPYAGSLRETLQGRFKVRGFPTTMLLDGATGEVLKDDIRGPVASGQAGEFPWPPKPLESLTGAVDFINTQATVVAFTDKLTDGGADEKIQAVMKAVAEDGDFWKPEGKPAEMPARFAIADEDDEMADNVRGFLGLGGDADGDDSFRIVVINIPKQRKHVYASKEVPDAAALKEFVNAAVFRGEEGKLGLKETPK